MSQDRVSLHGLRGIEVVSLHLLDRTYTLHAHVSGRRPVAHPGTPGKHHQVGEDQPPHVPIIAPRGGVNNRSLRLKELAKEGTYVLEHGVVGMHIWLMRD